jgi:hypothetical protein
MDKKKGQEPIASPPSFPPSRLEEKRPIEGGIRSDA